MEKYISGTKEVLFFLAENSVKIVPTGNTVKEIDLNFDPLIAHENKLEKLSC